MTTDLAHMLGHQKERRMTVVGFQGKTFHIPHESWPDLVAVGVSASNAIFIGHQAGDLRWDDPDRDFVWLAADNSAVPMDAPTAFAFFQMVAVHRRRIVVRARALKDQGLVDASDDTVWT
jgi:hypothetical protein